MNNLLSFCHSLFDWCAQQKIAIALARPKFGAADFASGDLDLLVGAGDVAAIIDWLQRVGMVVTCVYRRADGVTCHLFDPHSRQYVHLDFIDRLVLRGVPYLALGAVLGRAQNIDGLFYPDPVDQMVILVMTHGVKHRNGHLGGKYRDYLSRVVREFPVATLERLCALLGNKTGAALYDALLLGEKPQAGFAAFLSAAWQISGLAILPGYVGHYAGEFYRRMRRPVRRIAFLGVDGAGKTTLIHSIQTRMADSFPVIRHTRFIPAWPGQPERDSSQAMPNPHRHPLRGWGMSLIKMGYYALRYWIIVLMPRRLPILYLHDRYVTDIVVDPKRYRYGGPDIRKWLGLFPKPDALILLDIPAEDALARKQELPAAELKRQIAAYRALQKDMPEIFVLDARNPLAENTRIAEDIILSVLKG